jgi:hypothetical protein
MVLVDEENHSVRCVQMAGSPVGTATFALPMPVRGAPPLYPASINNHLTAG